MAKRLFTSESVTEGHPDKICDQISDAILDNILAKDPMARVACETCTTTGIVFVMGEITTDCYVDVENIVRETVREIGYDRAKYGFDCDSCSVITSLHGQSPDIAMGVDKAYENKTGEDTSEFDTGAGDQGMMFGFACDETEEYMPYSIYMAHKLSKRLTEVRKKGILNYLRPDGKTQVTVEYEEGKPKRIENVLVSTQHLDTVDIEKLREDVKREIIDAVIPQEMMDENTKIFINPTGRFVIGGPLGDTGLTGRKIIVDTYGGYARHGGGAFSGKDASKVDRSAAYMLRHIAKNIVANGYAKKCEIQVSYAIGVKEPISIFVNTFGTGTKKDEEIENMIKEKFDLTPNGIIKYLHLQEPIFTKTTNYGHFGKNNICCRQMRGRQRQRAGKSAGLAPHSLSEYRQSGIRHTQGQLRVS